VHHAGPDNRDLEAETVMVNVLGFMNAAAVEAHVTVAPARD
jgi:hypothetical protein